MPRIWIANAWLDPAEECGGLPHDYCADCYEDALFEWMDQASVAYHTGELDRNLVLEEIVVDDDEHPPYDDFGDYECLECGKTLTDEEDG